MDLNKLLSSEKQLPKTKKEKYILEIKNEASKENIINNSNKSQSNESTKTTEYSSESSELISKYLFNKYKKFHNNCNPKDAQKNNIKKNTKNENNTETYNKTNKKSKNKKKFIKAPKSEEYNSKYLNQNNVNIKAPKIPFIYDIDFEIDNIENNSQKGKIEFPQKNGININNKNYEYKKIARIPHDKLGHLIINKNLYKRKNNLNYNEIYVAQRVKHKFLTIIYFSPKKEV